MNATNKQTHKQTQPTNSASVDIRHCLRDTTELNWYCKISNTKDTNHLNATKMQTNKFQSFEDNKQTNTTDKEQKQTNKHS